MDGNERPALAACERFLDWNGLALGAADAVGVTAFPALGAGELGEVARATRLAANPGPG